MTATVLVNRSEISELKYFGLHNEFNSAGTTWTSLKRLLGRPIQKVVRRWNSSYPDGLYHKTREDMCWSSVKSTEMSLTGYMGCKQGGSQVSGGSTGGSQVRWGSNWVRTAGAQSGLGIQGA
ncbi:hypothetical protein B0H10DRAFT_1944659 [Mycena sp. CBHHK59/15]|nr:hypothetical protein B0H10DRAFT_1944659 [Mycena sp. CBHHK59/15]